MKTGSKFDVFSTYLSQTQKKINILLKTPFQIYSKPLHSFVPNRLSFDYDLYL